MIKYSYIGDNKRDRARLKMSELTEINNTAVAKAKEIKLKQMTEVGNCARTLASLAEEAEYASIIIPILKNPGLILQSFSNFADASCNTGILMGAIDIISTTAKLREPGYRNKVWAGKSNFWKKLAVASLTLGLGIAGIATGGVGFGAAAMCAALTGSVIKWQRSCKNKQYLQKTLTLLSQEQDCTESINQTKNLKAIQYAVGKLLQDKTLTKNQKKQLKGMQTKSTLETEDIETLKKHQQIIKRHLNAKQEKSNKRKFSSENKAILAAGFSAMAIASICCPPVGVAIGAGSIVTAIGHSIYRHRESISKTIHTVFTKIKKNIFTARSSNNQGSKENSVDIPMQKMVEAAGCESESSQNFRENPSKRKRPTETRDDSRNNKKQKVMPGPQLNLESPTLAGGTITLKQQIHPKLRSPVSLKQGGSI